MNIVLMRTDKPKNAMDKSPVTVQSLTGTLREKTSMLHPEITIQSNIANVGSINYMYIEDFGRYYWIHDIEVINNSLFVIHADVDTLYSFKTEILTNSAIIARQENVYNLYLSDPAFLAYQGAKITTHKFNYTFDTLSYVLAVAGGLDTI
ncbi:MAG: hypothetical protein J6Y47_00865 [Bacteroidales bacterium]|nr:hypothetical protein [Bacteroidales bacterium]